MLRPAQGDDPDEPAVATLDRLTALLGTGKGHAAVDSDGHGDGDAARPHPAPGERRHCIVRCAA